MSKITIHGGDFRPGADHSLSMGTLNLRPARSAAFTQPERIPLSSVVAAEIATEETVRGFWGALGTGAVAGVALGMIAFPLGLVGAAAGVVAGGRRKEVTFVAKLNDGRQMLATADPDTFKKIAGAAMTAASNLPPAPRKSHFKQAGPQQRRAELLCLTCGAWSSGETCACGAQKPADGPKRMSVASTSN